MTIDPISYRAFCDELVKTGGWISTARRLSDPIRRGAKGLGKAVSSGWKEMGEDVVEGKVVPMSGQGWLTKRRYVPTIRNGKPAWGYRLPIGPKPLMIGSFAAMAPAAVKKEDPYHIGRSRAERVSGLAADALGTLAGTGLAMKYLPGGNKSRWFKGLGGALAGGMGAHYLVTRPFEKFRKKKLLEEQANRAQLPETQEGDPALPANIEPSQFGFGG